MVRDRRSVLRRRVQSPIGVASDLLAPTLGDDSIRAALLLAVAASLGASVFFYVGARTLRADIERASRQLA